MSLKGKIDKYLRNVIVGRMQGIVEQERENVLIGVSRLQSIAKLHSETFANFKDKYKGHDVVLVGAGPSVKRFQPIKDCVYVGLNRACLLENAKFDYLFTIDKIGVDKIYQEFGQYACVKFVGDQNLGPAFQIPESEIAKMTHVLRYKTDAGLYTKSQFALDITSEPLGNFNTVSLQAMQFILYTNPKRVYLVGIDCTASGHFNEQQSNKSDHHERMQNRGENINKMVIDYVDYWKQLKAFADQYYPETEIISINPVGLRGLFNDLDQE